MESGGSSKSLAPGFRFHPTDEELVRYYLRRKVCGRPLRFDAISDIDIYKVEPWDLPGLSRLNTRDLEWYFFSVLDKKYGNGARTNRATEQGYWKTTGKDRAVHHKSQVVGMKKTLVYHSGRAPKGQRTNWVMHEYKLVDEELDKAGISQDAFVLCRVFQKSGAGPKNGEKYGAPFVDEEWEEDELQMVPKEETTDKLEFGDDIYLDGYELEQILGTETPVDGVPIHMNCSDDKNSTNGEEACECSEDAQNLLQQSDELKSFDPAVQHFANNPVEHEYIDESGKRSNSDYVDYLLSGPPNDASDELQFNEGAFLEANDLSNSGEVDNSGFDMFEEYLTYFDANDDFQNMNFDTSILMGNDGHVSDQASLLEKSIGEVAQQVISPSEQLAEHQNRIASSLTEKPTKVADHQYQFMKQASKMLGNIPAPPAFASEFPTIDAARHLNSMSRSTRSVHVSAGVIQIRDMTVGSDGSLGKHWYYNIILSFGLCQRTDNSSSPQSVASFPPGKATSTVSRGWFSYLFFSVLVLSMSFKIGTLIRAW